MQAGAQAEGAPRTAPVVRVYTLGTFRVLVAGQPVEDSAWRRRAARQLFKVLLARPGRRATRDEVVELFWPESDAEAASSSVRSTVHALRRTLQPGTGAPTELVFGDHTSIWLAGSADIWSDDVSFEQTVAHAWRAVDPLPLLQAASELYTGDFLPDDRYEDWSSERREVLRRTWTELQFGLAQALEAHADVTAAVQPLERLLRSDPCDERAAQELMRLLTRYGRRAEALRVYQRLSHSLHDELDVEPSPESIELHRQISDGESVAAPPIPAAAFRCAYPFPAPTELVGRQSELATLSHVVAGGRTSGQLALIAATAGTGKSALLGEIVRNAQAEGVLCLAGGCYEERGAVPLGPFHDALVDFLLAHAPDWLRAELGSTLIDLAQLIPELRYHLDLEPAAPIGAATLDRVQAFGAVHACLRKLAERGPLLLCLDDLHAADESTLQLLHYLARHMRRLPIVLLATYRDDEVAADHALPRTVAALLRERLAERLTPGPLRRADTDRLVGGLLDGPPSGELSDSLYAATGGNPLFVEQLVFALGDAGQLERKAGVWHALGELQGTPQIVRDVIADRLRRLDAGCRDILAMASVLGQAFEHGVLLAAAEPLREPELLAHLEHAIDAHVLRETTGGYAFGHPLLREAVYWGLTAPRRMLLHGRAGDLLERVYGPRAEDYAAQLAYHFGLAGDAAQQRGKALHYSLVAGERAAELSSSAEALVHFSRAWELLQADWSAEGADLRADVLMGRGLAESNLARYPESISTLGQALALVHDPVQRGRARKIMAFCLGQTGALDRMVDECDLGLAEIGELPGAEAIEIRATLKQLIATERYYHGHFADVVQLGRDIEREAAAGGPGPRLLAHWVIGWGYMGQGQVTRALEQYDAAVREGEALGEKVVLATCFENLGHQEFLGGQFALARDHLGQALALYRTSASELRAANSLHILCRVWVADGQIVRASEQIARSLELERDGHDRRLAGAYFVQGTVESLRANWAAARRSFERSFEIEQHAGVVPWMVEARVALGRVEQYAGDWDAAEARYTEALALASRMDPSPQRVLAERAAGELHLLRRNVDGATAHLRTAMVMVEGMAETLEYAPTLLATAALHAHIGELTESLALARLGLEHARPVEQITDAYVLLAEILLSQGDPLAAHWHAEHAALQAARVASPRHACFAHLASARSMAAREASRALSLFDQALRDADSAASPFARAAVLTAYAICLQATGEQLDIAAAMSAEARTINLRLGVHLPGAAPYAPEPEPSPP